MRKLVFRPDPVEDPPFRFDADVDRMERLLADAGYSASRDDIRLAWEAHSDAVCASWLSLGDDASMLAALLRHLREE